MPLAQVALLASAMKPERIAAGEEVVHQGDPGTSLYVIRSGEVEVVVEDEGSAEGEDRTGKRVAVLGRE